MPLAPLADWKARLLQMQPANDPFTGAMNLANFYGDMADNVMAMGGHKGIFTFNRALFAATLAPMLSPADSPAVWANNLSTAWQVAVAGSIIAPATVTNAAWLVSTVDVLTVPLGAATIITLSAAKAMLYSGLSSSQSTFSSQIPEGQEAFAKAFRDATLAFKFNCIGIAGTPISPVPLPLPLGAQ
jgi:hypothetical protein